MEYNCADGSRSRSRSPFLSSADAPDWRYHMDHPLPMLHSRMMEPAARDFLLEKRQHSPACGCYNCSMRLHEYGRHPLVNSPMESGHWSSSMHEQWSKEFTGRSCSEAMRSPCFSIRTPIRDGGPLPSDSPCNVGDRTSICGPSFPRCSSLRPFGARDNQISLHKWFLIPLQEAEFQVALGGFTRYGIHTEFLKTGAIIERMEKGRLKTCDGVEVRLSGFIDEEATIANGFSTYVAQVFFLGFPCTWKKVLEDEYFTSKTTRKEDSIAKDWTEPVSPPNVAIPTSSVGPETEISVEEHRGVCPETPAPSVPKGALNQYSRQGANTEPVEDTSNIAENIRLEDEELAAEQTKSVEDAHEKEADETRKETAPSPVRQASHDTNPEMYRPERSKPVNEGEKQSSDEAPATIQQNAEAVEVIALVSTKKRSSKKLPTRSSKRLRKDKDLDETGGNGSSNEAVEEVVKEAVLVSVATVVNTPPQPVVDANPDENNFNPAKSSSHAQNVEPAVEDVETHDTGMDNVDAGNTGTGNYNASCPEHSDAKPPSRTRRKSRSRAASWSSRKGKSRKKAPSSVVQEQVPEESSPTKQQNVKEQEEFELELAEGTDIESDKSAFVEDSKQEDKESDKRVVVAEDKEKESEIVDVEEQHGHTEEEIAVVEEKSSKKVTRKRRGKYSRKTRKKQKETKKDKEKEKTQPVQVVHVDDSDDEKQTEEQVSSESKQKIKRFCDEQQDEDHKEQDSKQTVQRRRYSLPPALPASSVAKSDVIEAYGLKTSRSGRLLVPPLAYWRNQTPVHDKDGGIIAILDGFQEAPSDTGYYNFKPPAGKKRLQEKLCTLWDSPSPVKVRNPKGKKPAPGRKR